MKPSATAMPMSASGVDGLAQNDLMSRMASRSSKESGRGSNGRVSSSSSSFVTTSSICLTALTMVDFMPFAMYFANDIREELTVTSSGLLVSTSSSSSASFFSSSVELFFFARASLIKASSSAK